MTNPTDVAREATGTDPRLEIIADVLRGLIPAAVPANLTVHIEEQLLAGQNSWHGSVEAVAARIHAALHGASADSASPLEQADAAKRRRDLGGEISALMGGQRTLENAPWHPGRPGDIVHVHYDAIPPFPAHGETYIVERPDEAGWYGLRLLTHTRPPEMGQAGDFAVDDEPDPLYGPWFEAGPHSLTIVRHGRVVHPGDAR